MNLPAFPKPRQIKQTRPPVKIFADGREICDLKTKAGHDEYSARKRKMWDRQAHKCCLQISRICKLRQGRLPWEEAQFEHTLGRTAGKRDDRIEVPDERYPEGNVMRPINGVACPWCNSQKGSRSLSEALKDLIP